MDEGNELETWEYQGGSFTTKNYWNRINNNNIFGYFNGTVEFTTSTRQIKISSGYLLYNTGIRITISEQNIELPQTAGGYVYINIKRDGTAIAEAYNTQQDGVIVVSFNWNSGTHTLSNPCINCQTFIVDGSPVNDKRWENLQEKIFSTKKHASGYYLGTITIDNSEKTISHSGGIVVFSNGGRSSNMSSGIENFSDIIGTGVVVFDSNNKIFKYLSASDEELTNNLHYVILAAFIPNTKEYVGNIYDFIVDGVKYTYNADLIRNIENNVSSLNNMIQNSSKSLTSLYDVETFGNETPTNEPAWGLTFVLNKVFAPGDRIISIKSKIVQYIPNRIGAIILSEQVEGKATILKVVDVDTANIQLGDIEIVLDYVGKQNFMVGIFGSYNGKSLHLSQSNDSAKYDVYRINTTYDLTEGSTIDIGTIFNFKMNIIVTKYLSTIDIHKVKKEIDVLANNKLTLYDDVRDLSKNFNILGFSASGTKIIANTSENYACYTKRFISDQRKAKYIISVPNQNGIVRVGALQSHTVDSTISYSTCCEIDFTNKKLKIYRGGGSNGTSALNLLLERDITQNLIGQTDFIIEISRNRKITSMRLVNYYTQNIDEIVFDGNEFTFGNGAGNHRPYYFIYTNIQNTEVTRLSIFGAYDVALAHIGDSLSESNGRADTSNAIGTNWIEQIMEEIGWDGSIVAQSGMGANSVIDALNNEIKFMRPKMLSVMIGTNGGVTDEQILSFKDFADENNIPYVQHHIPMTNGREPNAINSAQYIAEQLDRLGIIGARMDVATALNGNIEDGYNPDYFGGDKVHTNQLGNESMKRQFFIDLPQFIFNER